jgi:predicted RND superfamily exporter protein
VTVRFDRYVRAVERLIVDRTRLVIVAFLLATVVFGIGLGNVSTESGTQQFAEDIPEADAFEAVNDEFSPRFDVDSGSTQLIQKAPNVLSRKELLRMLEAQYRLSEEEELRVSETTSAARLVARELDPDAESLEEQIDAVEGATPSEIDRAVRALADDPRFANTLSTDFNREAASASATIGVVRHTLPAGLDGSAAGQQGGSSPLTPIQLQSERVVATVGGDVTVFGSGIISEEFGQVIGDSLVIVTPAAVVLIVGFLVFAYRDLVDLILGTFSLALAVVWTFGFLGLVGIPFNQIMIAVPPLLLAVGIDFGIHAINRYREDRADGHGIDESMRLAARQLLVAFFIVTGTTIIGFLSNLVSKLPPIRDFGIAAAGGIAFTFLVFGIFLPALKVWVDRLRRRYPIPTFSESPIGTEGSGVARALEGGVVLARRVPVVVLLLTLVLTAGAGVYATGVDTSFSDEDFLPPEEIPDALESLPEPFAPGQYSVVASINFLEDSFESSSDDETTVYVTGRMERDTALEELHRATRDPPGTFVTADGEARRASATSLATVVRDYAREDPEFAALVARNDRNANGIPDDNLGEIYDRMESSPAESRLDDYLAPDRRSTRIVYTVEADADQAAITADTRAVADRLRFAAIATGNIVVFQAVSDLILESAVQSLLIALAGTAVFLLLVYRVLEGRASLAFANLVPIVVAVALIAGSMRLLGIAFNAFTATILALTIGLGIDYSVHVVHRFVDERREHDLYTALGRTVRGTGGALAGSMLTTAFGIGVLVLAILSVLGQFGILTGLSIVYSFLASIFVLPSALVLWDRAVGHDPDVPVDERAAPRAGTGSDAVRVGRADDPLAPDREEL